MEFKSLSELYARIRPALISKKNDLKRIGINYIKEEDIWNCLKETKWVKTSNLSLSEMVNDIFNLDNYKVENYVKNKMNDIKREVNLKEDEVTN
ncbi:MAG: post-transcriptional regulator [Bacilli bacterium]|nr:post-transcriptional regulator [Bacilli bacterium]MDD4644072.1 post-transcriptional regulator [Bacilli bacterium]